MKQGPTKKHMNAQFVAKIAMLGALACIIMFFQFPVPFAPSFYQLDFSEVVVLIGGFALGPIAAIAIEAMKILLYMLLRGSLTMGIGELANFIIGCSFVLPCIGIYLRNKSKKQACLGLLCGSICMTIVAALINYFVLIPAYAFFMAPALTTEMIIDMGHTINANINGLYMLILLCIVPFNLLKAGLVSVIIFFSYKKLSMLLKVKS